MIPAINDVVQKYLFAYQPRPGKCVTYMTEGVRDIAKELGISYDAADELVRDYINNHF